LALSRCAGPHPRAQDREAFRTGGLALDQTGKLEASGITPAEGQSVVAAFAQSLKARCPPSLIASTADRGAGTGGDVGTLGRSYAEQLAAQFQANRDGVSNPYVPTPPSGATPAAPGPAGSSLAAAFTAPPRWTTPTDLKVQAAMERLVAEAVERMDQPPTSPKNKR
jgi:hypothetical protein